jgi:type I restriction enzyme M protein
VPVAEITSNDYDLSINRYKEVVYEEVKYDEPQVILKRIKELQQAMDKGITDLEAML